MGNRLLLVSKYGLLQRPPEPRTKVLCRRVTERGHAAEVSSVPDMPLPSRSTLCTLKSCAMASRFLKRNPAPAHNSQL